MDKPNLRERIWAGASGNCSNNSCKREIKWEDKCWYDRLGDVDYCHQCGIMLRYHRKKAVERGDKEPITLN